MTVDFQVMADVFELREPTVVPLYEHGVDPQIVEKVMGFEFGGIDMSTGDGQLEFWQKMTQFYDQMGYVYVPVEMPVRFAPTQHKVTEDTAIYSREVRGWVDEHGGPIQSMADLENPNYWPEVEQAFDYELFERVGKALPPGMKIIGGASGGPFEHASFLMGVENLCIAVYENEDLVEKLFAKIGKTIAGIAARVARLDSVGAYRFGDDLGYKGATIFSPALLRKYVFPWQKEVVAAVHEAGKPFLLHSCGQLEAVMEDLIGDVEIDGKHSFEDVIMPVAEAKKRWGDRIAIFGGIDVDFLCRHQPQEVKDYTLRVLEACAPGGGYAAGSGNTIANYVPVDNYLAMVAAVNEFNGA